jgi:hypothetical protein
LSKVFLKISDNKIQQCAGGRTVLYNSLGMGAVYCRPPLIFLLFSLQKVDLPHIYAYIAAVSIQRE